MTTQYPTPVSIAGSYEALDPSHKRAKITESRQNHIKTHEVDAKQHESDMSSLLEESIEAKNSMDKRSKREARTLRTTEDIQAAEVELAVWGYMLSTSNNSLNFLLSKESHCGQKKHAMDKAGEDSFSEGLTLKDYNGDNIASSGYLIGKNSECDVVISLSIVSERHCVIFKVNTTNHLLDNQESRKNTNPVVVHQIYLQDISGRGTYVNETLLKRNEVKLLHDADQVRLSLDGPSWTYKSVHTAFHKTFEEHFRIEKTLGRGHFAEVFEVADRSNGQRFAAKMIRKKMIADDKTFLQEIGLLMSCTHPLITCIRDVFETQEHVYLILELAAGGELFDRIIQKGHFNEHETRHLFKQLFSALQYLHNHSIVHRDIKPENILLTSAESLEIRVADFGLAKIVGSTTSTSTLAGTPSYIPPEMLITAQNGKALAYNRKVDSWSAGVVLYICLCGFPPFSNELAPPSMKTQIREGRYQFQRPYWDSVSDEAIDLVQRLLTVDPEVRYSITQALQHPFMQEHRDSEMTAIRGNEAAIHRGGVKRQRTMLRDIGRTKILLP